MKSCSKCSRAPAVVALLLGLQSVVAATSVLAGYMKPDYAVLRWLVVYNGVMGVLAIITAVLLWRDHRLARPAVGLVLAAYTAVLIGLGLMRLVGQTVANQSLMAMTFRVTVWAVIFAVVVAACRRRRSA